MCIFGFLGVIFFPFMLHDFVCFFWGMFILTSYYFWLNAVFHAYPRKHTGVPKALMVAKLGGEAALQKAVNDGDVVIVRDSGRDYYTWRSIEVSRSSGTSHETNVESGNMQLESEGQQQMSAFFDNFNPQLGNPKAVTMDPLKSPSGTCFNVKSFDVFAHFSYFICFCHAASKFLYSEYISFLLCLDKNL